MFLSKTISFSLNVVNVIVTNKNFSVLFIFEDYIERRPEIFGT